MKYLIIILLTISCTSPQFDIEDRILSDVLPDFVTREKEWSFEPIDTLQVLVSDSLLPLRPYLQEDIRDKIKFEKLTLQEQQVLHSMAKNELSGKPLTLIANNTPGLQLIKKSEFKRDRWDAHGIVSVSRCFPSEDKDIWAFHYIFLCGGECGHSTIFFVTKDQNKWKIYKEIEMGVF